MAWLGWLGDCVLTVMGANGGRWTDLWGGIFSCFVGCALVGGIWRSVNCHEKGCWRPGHHVGGTVVCHRHRGQAR